VKNHSILLLRTNFLEFGQGAGFASEARFEIPISGKLSENSKQFDDNIFAFTEKSSFSG
jgi:hypothetical protein